MEKEFRWRSCASATARRTNGCLNPPRALPDGQQATHNLIAVIVAASILRLQLLVDTFVCLYCGAVPFALAPALTLRLLRMRMDASC